MAQMSMNKAIHGAVRRDLRRFATALDRLQPGDTALAQRLGAAWDQFEAQLHEHHTGEHTIAWPAMAAIGVSMELLTQFDAEHDAMAAAMADTAAAFAALRRDPSTERIAAAKEAVTRLTDVTTTHLDHEEAESEELLVSSHDRPEVVEMGKKFGRVSPAQGGRFFAWVLDGASPDERSAITSSVPGPVLTIVGGIFGRGYRKQIAPIWAELAI